MQNVWKHLAVCAALLPLAATAQEIDATKRAAIKDLLDTIQAERQISSLGTNAQQQAQQESTLILEQALIENKKLTDDQKKAAVEKLKQGSVQKLADQAGKIFLSDAFKNDAVKTIYDIYGKNYSVEELKELSTFYKTPTGQKFLSTQASVDREIVSTLMQKYVPQVRKAARDAADKEINAVTK